MLYVSSYYTLYYNSKYNGSIYLSCESSRFVCLFSCDPYDYMLKFCFKIKKSLNKEHKCQNEAKKDERAQRENEKSVRKKEHLDGNSLFTAVRQL